MAIMMEFIMMATGMDPCVHFIIYECEFLYRAIQDSKMQCELGIIFREKLEDSCTGKCTMCSLGRAGSESV